MAAQVIAITVAKGGVGKSTLTYSLGAELARKGYRCRVLDCDDSKDSAGWVIDAALPGLDTAQSEDGGPADITEKNITTLIRTAQEEVDIVLLDLHGGMTALMTYAIARAGLVVIPAKVSEHDVNAVFRTEAAIRTTEDAFEKQIQRRVLLCQLGTFHTHAEAKARSDIEAEGIPLFSAALLRRTAFEKMSHMAQPLYEIDGLNGNAQKNLQAVTAEILQAIGLEAEALDAAE